MKNIAFLLLIASALSCCQKKEYTCQCLYMGGGYIKQVEAINKSLADKKCQKDNPSRATCYLAE
ncbi:MAG: hypothetical protein KA149_07490 [Chitinophagales bacterium]|nr:hypothetical protein [Chitinophagales bacterium]